MAERYDAPNDWGRVDHARPARPVDRNPYVHFDPDTCIACARCTRYCEEVEGVSAITLAGRGAETTISGMEAHELEKVRTTCNFCGVGCQLDLNVDREANDGRGQIVKVTSPAPGTTTNDGNLCVKGRFAYEFVHHDERLTVPLVRGEDGELHEATWEEALQAAAAGLQGVKQRHGSNGLGFVSSSRCTMEENYLVQKVARAVFGTNNVHSCAAT